MKHITTDKGDIGIAKVTADLIEKGYFVLSPISATSPFDLVAYDGKKFYKIQVKYRTGNILTVMLSRNVIHNGKNVRSSKNEFVDILAIYSPVTDKCYYIDAKTFNKGISIRLTETKNKQKNKVNHGDSFLKFPKQRSLSSVPFNTKLLFSKLEYL